jgi:hypothetical protein
VEVGCELTFGKPKTKRSRPHRATAAPCFIRTGGASSLVHDPAPEAVVFTGLKGPLLRRAGFTNIPEPLYELLTFHTPTFPLAGPMPDHEEIAGKVDGSISPLTSTFEEWPLRDLNPCYRLERAD